MDKPQCYLTRTLFNLRNFRSPCHKPFSVSLNSNTNHLLNLLPLLILFRTTTTRSSWHGVYILMPRTFSINNLLAKRIQELCTWLAAPLVLSPSERCGEMHGQFLCEISLPVSNGENTSRRPLPQAILFILKQ